MRKRNLIMEMRFNFKRAKIIKLEYAGKREVFNIETTTGNYIANGFAVHNCYARKIATRFKGSH